MIRKLFLLAALALAAPAQAAETITITMVSDGTSGTYNGTLSKSITLTAADMAVWQNYLLATYPTSCTPQPCTPPVNTVPLAALAWVAGEKAGWTASVLAWQRAGAITTAVGAITPINPN